MGTFGGHTLACPDLLVMGMLNCSLGGSSDAASGYQHVATCCCCCSCCYCYYYRKIARILRYKLMHIPNIAFHQNASKMHKKEEEGSRTGASGGDGVGDKRRITGDVVQSTVDDERGHTAAESAPRTHARRQNDRGRDSAEVETCCQLQRHCQPVAVPARAIRRK